MMNAISPAHLFSCKVTVMFASDHPDEAEQRTRRAAVATDTAAAGGPKRSPAARRAPPVRARAIRGLMTRAVHSGLAAIIPNRGAAHPASPLALALARA